MFNVSCLIRRDLFGYFSLVHGRIHYAASPALVNCLEPTLKLRVAGKDQELSTLWSCPYSARTWGS